MRFVPVCDLETSWMRTWHEFGSRATINENISPFGKASCSYKKRCQFDFCFNWILLLSLQKSWLLLEWLCLGLKFVNPTGHYMHHQFIFQQLYSLPTLFLSLCIYLITNSDLCHLLHKLIGFFSRDEKFLQRGTDWGFKIRIRNINIKQSHRMNLKFP